MDIMKNDILLRFYLYSFQLVKEEEELRNKRINILKGNLRIFSQNLTNITVNVENVIYVLNMEMNTVKCQII